MDPEGIEVVVRRPLGGGEQRGRRGIPIFGNGGRNQRGHPRGGHRGGRQNDNWRTDNRDNQQNNDTNRRPRGQFGDTNRRPRGQFGPRPRPERRMGFQYVENLINNEDIQHVILTLCSDKSGFKELLDSKEMTNDMVVLLVKLLFNICNAAFQDIKISLLTTALRSRFMEKLQLYITTIATQDQKEKFFNKHFWNDTDQFWNALIKLAKTVQELIPSYCEAIQKLLKTTSLMLPVIEGTHSIHIPDEIKAQTLTLLDLVEKTLKNLEVRTHHVQRQVPFEEDEEPPDDFRQIEIIPSAQEVVTEHSPFLRANIIDRPFNSINQYLDIQFRLLREDFVAPLRRGISTFLRNQTKAQNEWKKVDDIKIYKRVMFLSVETVNECNCYKIRFDFSKKKRTFQHENSKRFMFGSLVCFTRDNFQSLLFGKIVQRDVKLLEQGLLIVGFMEDVVIDFEADYLMVESSVYFEPYYQVLGVLKRMSIDSFPMEKYIINVEADTGPPSYLLKDEPVFYEIEEQRFWSLNFPNQTFYNLNDSQLSAFKAALTNEFSIIQGPPGTGKTYVGLRIAHTLLQNYEAWYNHTPILVICYTNHALDQFLEGILESTEKILRVGGQSKDENLKKFNIAAQRQNVHHQAAVHEKRREVRDCMQHQKTLSDTLNRIYENESVISFSCFEDVVENYSNSWFATAKQEDIKRWLLEGKSTDAQAIRARNDLRQAQQGIGNFEATENTENQREDDAETRDREYLDDVFQGVVVTSTYKPLLTVAQLRDKLKVLRNEFYQLRNDPEPASLNRILREEKLTLELWETETDLDYLWTQLDVHGDLLQRTPRPNHFDLQNPFNMRYADRWQLYYYWLHKYIQELRRKYVQCGLKFREIYRVYNDMREIEDIQLMRQNLVVGMTTTGAARLQSSLQALKSPIVIVEEAAEVLEAHIVAALTKHCKHLILIGDHLQLKPTAADYKIENKFKLGISLFERMVRNKIKCHTLNVQHRMRPEISRLVKPHIYPDLQDHETTLQRAPILGLEKCLYFIDHQEPEELCQDASKKSIHESKFLISLARHLILNGYKPEQITILAAYLGQFFEMKREKRRDDNKLLLEDVRISVLDNYQGEESDIILLSLVRSNAENKAGFLRIQNRVCVALSRARDGFYIMGNMSLLLRADSENQIWEKVKAVLDDQEAIGTQLSLRCQVHRHKITQVSKSEDFVKLSEGGCDLLCESPLGCGHKCMRLCHPQDRTHEKHQCGEKCIRTLCNDNTHVCKKLCYEECGPCTYLVSRDLECGHKVDIQCHIDPAKYECIVPVFTKLPCDHETDQPCSADPVTYKCPFPCDTRVEPCGHACDRTCHIRFDPDHLKYKCMEPCAKSKVGCRLTEDKHICSKLCFQDCEDCLEGIKKIRSCGHAFKVACKLDVEDEVCRKPCKKILPCGHDCKNECAESCGPCEKKVEKTIQGCEHKIKLKCHQAPVRMLCASNICPRLLPCGHQCKRRCKEPCSGECYETVDCNIRTPCGHELTKIMCSIKNTDDPKMLLKYCTEPCGVTLKCNHKCTGTCGKCMQSRIHIRCAEKCGVPLVCNHECEIPCREACKPCTRDCEVRCKHSKCKKKCGEPCTPCKAPCSRRCPHVVCSRKCGFICNVPPCVEKCEKRLKKCGHPCVGFCGDPCPPLCRICHKDELTDIFFGTEDEEDAIFVLLRDCGHVLEHSGLENWMNEGGNQIQFKTCPKCKTNINTTERYSDYVKSAIMDIVKVKVKYFGDTTENEDLRKQLLEDLGQLETPSTELTLANLYGRQKEEGIGGSKLISNVLQKLSDRLRPFRNGWRQAINQIELNAIRAKIQTLKYIIDCFKQSKQSKPRVRTTDLAIPLLNELLNVLLRSEDHVTNQEIEDLQLEIKRLHRVVQFDNIRKSDKFEYSLTISEVKTLNENVQETLFVDKRYTTDLDDVVKTKLQDLAAKVDRALHISDKERIEIVAAMQLGLGHWYKCPKGHPYAIGECGGANQVAKCFCGEAIGGTDHHLLPTNQLAGEMDGARRHAWPGGLY